MEPSRPLAASVHRLLTLPNGVLTIVLNGLFSADDVRLVATTRWAKQLPPHVRAFASVCQAWRALIREVASASVLSRFTISLSRTTRSAVVELRRKLTLRRTHTQRLDLERAPNVDVVDGVMLWRSMFSHAPHTKLLDLTTISADSRTHLLQFVAGAGDGLPRVHTLHFPQYKMNEPSAAWMGMMVGEMVSSLERWYVRGQVGGVRVIRASFGDYMGAFRGAHAMVDTLARYCPNLERLETDDGLSGICMEQWKLDLETWRRFCESCSCLTEFDFVHVPFATSFFEIFGQHSKPKLVKLNLRPAINWDAPEYIADAPPALRAVLESSGCGDSAVNAFAVLRACPNLRELRVEWRILPPLAAINMNPEVFGDELLENVARSCPLLERFISTGRYFTNEEWEMLESLTDRSLHALATLPRLEFVELGAKNITGDAVYDLVVHHVRAARWSKREYHILVGESQQHAATEMATFYHTLLRFLQRLADEKDSSTLLAQPTSLWLVNNSDRTAGKTWYTAYMAQLKEYVAQVQELHPTVSMQIALVQKGGDKWSHQIASFGFSTSRGTSEPWDCGDFTHRQGVYRDVAMDKVFIRRCRHEFYWASDEDDEEQWTVSGP